MGGPALAGLFAFYDTALHTAAIRASARCRVERPLGATQRECAGWRVASAHAAQLPGNS